MSPYKHTQTGTWSRVTFGALFLFILATAASTASVPTSLMRWQPQSRLPCRVAEWLQEN